VRETATRRVSIDAVTTAPIEVCVTSEIAPLERVLVHRPGDEVVRMTQHDLDALLFDDILSPSQAVREHDLMIEIIAQAGAEVIDVATLLDSALTNAPEEATRRLIQRICERSGAAELAPHLARWAPAKLARALVTGLRYDEVADAPLSLNRMRRQLRGDRGVALSPLPNLMFMRDPCMAIADRVLVGQMATDARAKEPLVVAFAIAHSGAFTGSPLLRRDEEEPPPPSYQSIEGGDVLVISPRCLLIGCSERTRAQTIERVAQDVLFSALPKLERVYAVMMPEHRSVMHLDTILTQVDAQLFLGHAPFIGPGERALAVVRIEREQQPELLANASVLDLLSEELGDNTTLVPCGGDDPLHQEREQWTDGANALALAPGHIVLYARNVHTIAALRAHGFVETGVHMMQSAEERASLIADGMANARTVFSFAGSELSRARGGGRCLTMPVRRAP